MKNQDPCSPVIGVADVAAKWAADLSWAELPDVIQSELIKGLTQSITGGVAGFDVPETLAALAIARSEQSNGPCHVFVHGDSMPVSAAVFVNSVMFCALEQQEMHSESATHPFETVVPTALALCEQGGVTGVAFLEAVLAGFEVMAGFAQTAQEYMPQTAPGSTLGASVHGALGAATTAAKLMGLETEGIARALGHAANFASGLNESNLVGFTEYHYSLANASRVGLLAAQLARSGQEVSPTTFDGPAGYFHRFAELPATRILGEELSQALGQRLGTSWALPQTLYKTYPVHFYNLPYIDGARFLRQRHGLAAADIEHIHLYLNHWCQWCKGQDLGPYTRRESTRGATAFGVASMLARGHFDLADAADPAAGDIANLVAKTSVEVFQEEARAAMWRAVRIEIQTSRGAFVYDSADDPMLSYKLTREQVDQIARQVLARALPGWPADKLIALIAQMDELPDMRMLTNLMINENQPEGPS